MKSKKSLLAVLCFMAMLFIGYSQTQGNRAQNAEESGSGVNQIQNSLGNISFESNSAYFNSDSSSESPTGEYKAASTTGFIVKTVVVLILVVAAIYGIMLFFKKKNNVSKSDDEFLRRVSSLPLSAGKSIEVVSLIDHAYILGVSDSNINLIAEVEDKELIEAMNLNFDRKQNVKKPMNFSDVLEIFMPHGPRNNAGVYAEAERKVSDLDNHTEEESNEE